MRNRIIAGVAFACFAVPALAHHSFAMFDHARKATLPGTVKDFEWVQPHVWLHITVTNEAGKAAEWAFEAGGPGQLTVSGWTKDSVKPGDKVEVTFHPLKDGSNGGMLLETKLPSGQTLCQGPECRAAAGVRGPGD